MIEATIVGLWRDCVRLLRTEKERVGVVERWLRACALTVPFLAAVLPLWVRAAVRGPLTLDGTTEDGVRFRCRLPDLISTYLYLFGTWEPDLAAFVRRRLRPGDTFVDVGANIGCLTALASRLVGPRGAVVAIEPSPAIIDALQETVSRNDLANVRIVAAAVSDRDHELPLFAGPSSNVGKTSTVAHRGSVREQGWVRAAPLGSLVDHEQLVAARLIKIDVEGAEDRALAGMVASLEALAADAELLVELSPRWWADPGLRPVDVLRPFLDRGFHVYQLPNSYRAWRYLWPRDVEAPRRLRDLAILDRRVARLDLVLSRSDADVL
jgi:FkbM family methyltransferase